VSKHINYSRVILVVDPRAKSYKQQKWSLGSNYNISGIQEDNDAEVDDLLENITVVIFQIFFI